MTLIDIITPIYPKIASVSSPSIGIMILAASKPN